MSAPTAAIVLKNRTLRWSSPVLFNDPFDVPRELSFSLTPVNIVQALARRVAALIKEPPRDTSNLESELCLVIDAVKSGISEELKARLIESAQESGKTHRPTGQGMETLREMWRNWLPQFRILCLTESPEHAAMWYHYADQYRGVVLELRCADEHDSAWLAAKPVTYPRLKPLVYTAEGWAELLTLRHEIAVRTILETAIYTKAPDWEYEGEWRTMTFKRKDDTGLFTDYKLHPEELSAVYFGPRISRHERETIAHLASNYPNAKLLNVSIGMSRAFEFTAADG